MGCNDHELSLVIMDDKQIRELNKNFMGIDKPTNVLSFPMQEGQFSEITPGLLGDVVISLDRAKQEADSAGILVQERMSQLLIHGILHLLGFDHEQGENQAQKMEKKSIELLRIVEENKELNSL